MTKEKSRDILIIRLVQLINLVKDLCIISSLSFEEFNTRTTFSSIKT